MVRKAILIFGTLVVFVVLVTARLVDVYRGPGKVHEASATRIVVLGDSVARGLGSHVDGALNLGVDGARTTTITRRFDIIRASLQSADAVVLSIGGNDLFGDTGARIASMVAPKLAICHVSNRVHRIVDSIRHENSRAHIYLLGLYNPYRSAPFGAWVDEQVANWDAEVIQSFAQVPAVTVIRIADLLDSPEMISATDHFHPSAAGYAAIAARIGVVIPSRAPTP